MHDALTRPWWTILCLAACTCGCSKPSDPASTGDEAKVRETVAALQAALKAQDADKLWDLLDSESQADAERAAKAAQAAYAKASPEQKAEQEKALGLAGAELTGLTGKGFLKTKRFHGKYDEVPDSKIEKVTVQGDQATVTYIEPDDDKEKLTLVRQGGKWKLSLPIPKGD